MTHLTLIGLLTFIVCQASAQTSAKCNCAAIVDIGFKGKIVVYDKPNRRAIKNFRQNYKKDDYLVLTINRDSSEYFHVDLSNALSPQDGQIGWIKKTNQIGTFARNYGSNDTLLLYSKPALISKVQSFVPNGIIQLYTITKCHENWAYVVIKYKGQIRQGWLQPDKQCDNPYTTCN